RLPRLRLRAGDRRAGVAQFAESLGKLVREPRVLVQQVVHGWAAAVAAPRPEERATAAGLGPLSGRRSGWCGARPPSRGARPRAAQGCRRAPRSAQPASRRAGLAATPRWARRRPAAEAGPGRA